VPFKAYDFPAVSGVVQDGSTGRPIAGAQILVQSKEKADLHAAAVSDKSGRFSTPEMTHTIWLPPLPFDLLMPDCTIRVSARGYADRQFDFYDELKAQRSPEPNSHLSEIVLKLDSAP
jgi:hypothetical protein